MSDGIIGECDFVKVCAKPGQLILWDGKMFHCNTQPTGDRPRMCTYVSMVPRDYASTKELQKGVSIYEKGKNTGHWRTGPYFGANPVPRTWGKDPLKPSTPQDVVLSPLCRRLVGYKK